MSRLISYGGLAFFGHGLWKWFSWTRHFSVSTRTTTQASFSLECLEEALHQLEQQRPPQLQQSYASLLKLCGNANALSHGKRLHAHILEHGLGLDAFLGDHLVQMYGKCGSLEDANVTFDNLSRRNVFSWNFIIGAFARHRHGRKALELFKKMDSEGVKPDVVTIASVLGACASLRALEEGKAIHARVASGEFPSGVVVETALVKLYGKCGKVEDARAVFDKIQSKDLISWNAMIAAYAQNGHDKEARCLYEEMETQGLKANDTTFAGMLGACNSLEEGKKIHSRIIVRGLQSSIVIQNALVSMYARCRRLDVARMVFDQIQCKNVVSWNAIVAAYAQQGHHKEALQLYENMDLQPNEVTFASVLGACFSLQDGKGIHERVKATQFKSNVTVATALITMYAKSAEVDAAREVFDRMQHRNVVSWNAMLGAYAQNAREREALDVYENMVSENVQPDAITIVITLGICSSLGLLELGKLIHKRSIDYGHESNVIVQNALVSMYGRCNELQAARQVFDKMKCRDVVSWTAVIAAYTHHGHDKEALELYKQMESEGVEPDSVTYTSILSACSSMGALEEGQTIHACLRAKRSLHSADMVEAAVINMYAKCGRMDLASEVFQNSKGRTVVTWNAMITAYTQLGRTSDALDLYGKMESAGVIPNEGTFSSVLSACSDLKALQEGKAIHLRIVKDGARSSVVQNALVNMYASCGKLDDAERVLDEMQDRDVVSWTAMISAYGQHGLPRQALHLYKKMSLEGVQPNDITFVSLINACSAFGTLREGIAIHASCNSAGFHSDDAVQAALITMYTKCQSLDNSTNVFYNICQCQTSVNSWNAMIAANAQLGYGHEAIELYNKMSLEGIQPNEGTFAGILGACSSIGALQEGIKIHAQISASRFRSNVLLETALVNMYAKCSRVDLAKMVFERIETRDVVSWNAMIAAYAQNGHGRNALDLYHRMIMEGVQPDSYTLTIVLSVCSNIRALKEGKGIHDRAISRSPELGLVVESALFNMYAKCGKLELARRMFEQMKQRNVVCWHGLIAAYAHHGHGKETLQYYREFKLEGFEAPETTFSSVFLACGHAGLLDEGRSQFHTMLEDGIAPTFEHYVCMVNLFARAGRLTEAEDLLSNMPFQPNSVAWTALLGACRTHGDLDRARRAAKQSMQLDHEDSAPYVLLSNIYAAAGCFDHMSSTFRR